MPWELRGVGEELSSSLRQSLYWSGESGSVENSLFSIFLIGPAVSIHMALITSKDRNNKLFLRNRPK